MCSKGRETTCDNLQTTINKILLIVFWIIVVLYAEVTGLMAIAPKDENKNYCVNAYKWWGVWG